MNSLLLRPSIYPRLHLAHLGHLKGSRRRGSFENAGWMVFVPGSRESDAHAGAAVRQCFFLP